MWNASKLMSDVACENACSADDTFASLHAGLPKFFIAAIGNPESSRVWAIVLGVLFAIVAISLLLASWTRWGQTKALTKCVALAILAHIWLLLYAYGTRIVSPGIGGGTGGGVAREVAMPMDLQTFVPSPLDSAEPSSESEETQSERPDQAETSEAKPWESPTLGVHDKQEDAPKLPELLHVDRPDPAPIVKSMLEERPRELSEADLLALARPLIEEPEIPDLPVAPIDPTTPAASSLSQVPAAPPQAMPQGTVSASNPTPPMRQDSSPVPSVYQMRVSPLRGQFAMQNGGDANTESSVQLALAWLASNQQADGSWNAASHGAGRVVPSSRDTVESRERSNAGIRANTAMTGLALLAFLGAGHTHLDGPYAENVARGLRYLMQQQFPSGDLSGRDQVGQEASVRFARMYSHGMAGLAISEAFAMTGDRALLSHVQSAAKYTATAMNPRTGGWRYDFASDDPGDTSQFGWQAMLLNSASTGGAVQLTPGMRLSLERFLDSVSTGRSGGLAVYRNVNPNMPAEFAGATPAMTAEALALRLMLDLPVTAQGAREASGLLMRNLPGNGEENLYYWYYATLALYQLRGGLQRIEPEHEAAWERWNQALKQHLLATQVANGDQIGSWNPNCVWGGYGGRVYSTALSCMCLEVYYRYLPVYHNQAKIANRPR